jgi:hypothetical protein
MADDYPRRQAAAQPRDKTRNANVTRPSPPSQTLPATGSHTAIHQQEAIQ